VTATPPKPTPPPPTNPPTAMHLSFAKHGRTGKSTWLKLLIEYARDRKQPYLLVDTDVETPDVAAAYSPELLDRWRKHTPTSEERSIESLLFEPASPTESTTALVGSVAPLENRIGALLSEQIVFSEDNRTEYLTRNLLSLSQFGKDIFVNLPANVYHPVCNFIDNNNLQRSSRIKLFNWWVSNGSDESLNLFTETQAKFPAANHILVLNQGNQQYVFDWKRFRVPEKITALYQAGKIKIAMMPFLSIDPTFWESQKSIPYHNIIKDKSIDEFVRDAIETWTIKAFSAIEQTKCL
jgi:hypothetical protein